MTRSFTEQKLSTVHFKNDLKRSGVFLTEGVEVFNRVKWKFQTAGRIYSSPVTYENTVFIGSEDAHFYAIDKMTGSKKWAFPTGGAVRSSAAICENRVIFTSMDGKLYCLDAVSGKELWIFETMGEKMLDPWDYFLSSPLIDEGLVYFGSGDRNIYAVNLEDGSLELKFETRGAVHCSPAILDDTLYIGSFDGHLYALEKKTGEQKWAFRTVGDTWFPNGEIQGSICIEDGIVYFGSRDYNLYAVDARTGRGRWNFKAPGTWIVTTPTVKGGLVYFGTSDHSLIYAMDAKSGELKWSFPVEINTFGSVAIAGEVVYFGNMNGKFYALDKNEGSLRWVYETEASKLNSKDVLCEEGKLNRKYSEKLKNASSINDFIEVYDAIMSLGSILSTPFIEDGTIYFGSADGGVYAIE